MANGNEFDFADPTEEIQVVESYMSELRYFMSVKTINTLDKIETNILQLDTEYATKTDAIKGEVHAYGHVVDTLIATIGDPDFATNFNKENTLAKIALIAPKMMAIKDERNEFIARFIKEYGFEEDVAKTIWKVFQSVYQYYSASSEEYRAWVFNRLLGGDVVWCK